MADPTKSVASINAIFMVQLLSDCTDLHEADSYQHVLLGTIDLGSHIRMKTQRFCYNRIGLIGARTAAGLFFHTDSSASTYSSISLPSGS